MFFGLHSSHDKRVVISGMIEALRAWVTFTSHDDLLKWKTMGLCVNNNSSSLPSSCTETPHFGCTFTA